jgi:IrrE N-terminal-like domain
VNRYRHRDGDERIWITPNEMEDLMSAELIKARLMPDLSDPVVDLAAFVEQHLKAAFDSYAPLESTVLGETEFRVGARPKVSINKDLTGAALDDDESQPGLLGRWRATVAHEATHVIVHRCLFNLNEDQGSLFAELDAAEPEVKHLQRCMKRDVLFRGSGTSDWREIQANMGMAALLMPKGLFVAAVRQEMEQLHLDRVDKASAALLALVERLAMRFKVSKQATGIRFETLEILSQYGQATIMD